MAKDSRCARLASFVAVVLSVALLLPACTTVSAVKASKAGTPIAFSALRNRGEVTVLGRDVSVTVNVDEFSFSPTFVRVSPGSTVEFVLRNRGNDPHSFVIDERDVKELFRPGRTYSESVVAPMTGSLVFYCRLHRNLGMQGAIVVTPRTAPTG